jgi:hypothetical protein
VRDATSDASASCGGVCVGKVCDATSDASASCGGVCVGKVCDATSDAAYLHIDVMLHIILIPVVVDEITHLC